MDAGSVGDLTASRVRFPALDGLRGVAILAVMLCHYTEPGQHIVFSLTHAGWFGVDLFFVLSGLLVTGILLDARATPHALRNFYARRTLRIFPLYYGFLFVTLLLLPALKPAAELGLTPAVEAQGWLWTYTTNLAQGASGDWIYNTGRVRMHHFWSLAIEEQFYLVWPWVVLFAPPRLIRRACVVALVASPALRAGLLLGGADPLAALVLTPCRLDALAAGSLLALMVREPGGRDVVRRFVRTLLAVGTGALSVLWAWRGNPFNLSDPVVITATPTALAALFAGAVAFAVTSSADSRAHRLCAWGPLRAIGTISYGLYVLHLPVLSFVGRWVGPGFLTERLGSEVAGVAAFTLLGFGLSLSLATASWLFFERPVLRLKHFFEYHPPRAVTASDARSLAAGPLPIETLSSGHPFAPARMALSQENPSCPPAH